MSTMPTRIQIEKERAVLYTALADLAVVMLMFGFAASTHSLTLLSEAVRVALMLVIEFYSLFILRAVHRARLGKFAFGIGKIEQICSLAIGLALLFSGCWVGMHLVDLILFRSDPATPLGLSIAAAVNAINMLINLLGWYAMVVASRGDDSPIFTAQLRSRVVKLVSSVFVQITMTIAALSRDPAISIGLDAVGAAFVAGTMLIIGARMVCECAPDLLDRPVPSGIRHQLVDALAAAGVEPSEIARLRTRRSGSFGQIDVTLAPLHGITRNGFEDRSRAIEQAISERIPGARVGVHLDTEWGWLTGRPAGGAAEGLGTS